MPAIIAVGAAAEASARAVGRACGEHPAAAEAAYLRTSESRMTRSRCRRPLASSSHSTGSAADAIARRTAPHPAYLSHVGASHCYYSFAALTRTMWPAAVLAPCLKAVLRCAADCWRTAQQLCLRGSSPRGRTAPASSHAASRRLAADASATIPCPAACAGGYSDSAAWSSRNVYSSLYLTARRWRPISLYLNDL